jgi:transcriptional regulator with XRE-family HTH domain
MMKSPQGHDPQAQTLDVSQPEFGQRLRQLRQGRGMSQRDLAGTQLSASYISLLEAGQRVPTLNVAVALARRLETSPEELIGKTARHLLTESEPSDAPLLVQMHANDASDIGDQEEARRLLTEALAQAREEGNQQQIVQLGTHLQEILHLLGAHEARLVLLEELLALPVVRGSVQTELSLLITQASALRESGHLVEARQMAMTAMRRTTDPVVSGGLEHVRLLGVLVSVLCELGDLDQVRPLVQELTSLAAKLGRPSVSGRASWAASMAYALLGESDEAYEHLRVALRDLPYASMSLRDWLRFCRAVVSTLLDLQRDMDLAYEWLQSAEAAARTVCLAKEQTQVRALRARYELLTGNPQGALEIYETIDHDQLRPLALAPHTGHAQALREMGRLDEAADVLRKLANLCERSGAYQMAVGLWRQVDELSQAANRGKP